MNLLLRKAAEFLEVSSKIANPDLWQKVSSLTTEALQVGVLNLGLQKKVADLEARLQDAEMKLHFSGDSLLDVAAAKHCLEELQHTAAEFKETEAAALAEAIANGLYWMCGAELEPFDSERLTKAKASRAVASG